MSKKPSLPTNAEAVRVGEYPVGEHIIRINRCAYDESPVSEALWFEVMVVEVQQYKGCVGHMYVHLVDHPKFALFAAFGKYDRKLTQEEVTEYNNHVERRYLLWPTFRLSRGSIVKLFEVCTPKKQKVSPSSGGSAR